MYENTKSKSVFKFKFQFYLNVKNQHEEKQNILSVELQI